mgnify:CR=1 FL=1
MKNVPTNSIPSTNLMNMTTHKPKRPLADLLAYLIRNKYLYLLLAPGILFILIFNYIPMYGVIIAFKNFSFTKGIMGSPWNDFENFKTLFGSQDFYRILFNSLYLSFLRIVINFPIPILLALMLNEVRHNTFKRITQTVMYLPHFISWVVIGGISIIFLSSDGGLINESIKKLGFESIPFLSSTKWFGPLVVATNVWKEAGWGMIIYLAALTGINPEYYEAATVDGCSRLQKIIHITLPGIRSTIVVLLVLAVGKAMNNGFEHIFILQNNMNLSVSEVFETYTYRVGLTQAKYSFATAVGLFQSAVGVILITVSNRAAKALGQEAIY